MVTSRLLAHSAVDAAVSAGEPAAAARLGDADDAAQGRAREQSRHLGPAQDPQYVQRRPLPSGSLSQHALRCVAFDVRWRCLLCGDLRNIHVSQRNAPLSLDIDVGWR